MRKLNIIVIVLLAIVLISCDNEKDLFDREQEQDILADQTRLEDSGDEIESKQENPVINTEDKQDINLISEAEEDVKAVSGYNDQQLFYAVEITNEIKERINGKSYGVDCDIPYEELRYVRVMHIGFDGKSHEGELIVNEAIAEDIVEIFKELYELQYPIERMVLVDEYDADDNTSMAANNSSAFNYRKVDGTDRLSLHSLGLAIDINPLYNPYVREREGKTIITPVNGAEYADRALDCKYYILSEDPCYKAFTKRGFTWGGDWRTVKDYQHFQKEVE
jgi:hypothetical protein